MLLDALTLTDSTELETDLCIVGAGPGGIALAREMIGRGFRVCLAEGGGFDHDEQAARLSPLAEVASELDCPEPITRRRQFGGGANVWRSLITGFQRGVRLLPLDAIDFETREAVPHSGWPFSKADLEPYYARAAQFFGVDPSYELEHWEEPGAERLPLDERWLATSIEQFGAPTLLTEKYRRELEEASDVTLLLHANAVGLDERPSADAIGQLRVACVNGRRHRISASLFVLAAGGIENARLLQVSTGRSASGVGNAHDVVGRYFMDHMVVYSGALTPRDPRLFDRLALYDIREVRGTPMGAKLGPSEDRLRSDGLLNAAAKFLPRLLTDQVKAVQGGRRLAKSLIRERRLPADTAAILKELARRGPGVVGTNLRLALAQRQFPPSVITGWSALRGLGRLVEAFEFMLQVEMAPNPQNRVVLSDERDALDVPRPAVRWGWSDVDLQSVRRVQRIMADSFARDGLGTVELPPDDEEPRVTSRWGVSHHIGTTRIHADPRQGVVDAECRVHGLENLYVVGSSVFPTGGYANPTLTLVALAMRLADRLRTRLAATPHPSADGAPAAGAPSAK